MVFGVAVLFSRESVVKAIDEASLLDGARHVVKGSDLGQSNNASGGGEISNVGEASESGNEDLSLVTVVEFSDFQCSVCQRAQSEVKAMLQENGDRVRFVFRQFPLVSLHQNAFIAAEASEVMAEKGLFWKYHDLLYERQRDWEEVDPIEELLADYAEELGVDRVWFLERIKNDEIKARVNEDLGVANRLGLNGTPTFFVDGIKVNWNELAKEVSVRLN